MLYEDGRDDLQDAKKDYKEYARVARSFLIQQTAII